MFCSSSERDVSAVRLSAVVPQVLLVLTAFSVEPLHSEFHTSLLAIQSEAGDVLQLQKHQCCNLVLIKRNCDQIKPLMLSLSHTELYQVVLSQTESNESYTETIESF